MTLAVALSLCLFCSAPISALGAASGWRQSSGQQAPAANSPGSLADPGKEKDKPTSPPNPPAKAKAPSPSAVPSPTNPGQGKPTAGTRRVPKKKKTRLAANCTDPAPAAGSPPSPGSSTGDTAAASAAQAKCPPPKTVVHNGGTSEPRVQLTGGAAGAQASGKNNTDQLLGSTAENLKKIEGRQLNSSQQEMLNQVHQFLQQSKAAVDAGDIERGHNLAMKAHLLSDELAKP